MYTNTPKFQAALAYAQATSTQETSPEEFKAKIDCMLDYLESAQAKATSTDTGAN